MDHSQIVTIEDIDMSESLVCVDDIVDLEKDADEFGEDDLSEIMANKDGECGEDNAHAITGDVDTELSKAPILTRVFETSEEAYAFYNAYAKGKGFEIRKQYHNKRLITKQIYRWNYVCSKQGVKRQHDKRADVDNVKRQRDTRINCMAMLQVKLVDGLWKVEKFNDIHNHPLINTPTKVKKFLSQNELRRSDLTKSVVSKLYQEGLTSSKISKVVSAMNKEVNLTSVQINSIIYSQRKNNVGRECQGIIKHFQKKSMVDGAFYFDMDLEEDGTLRSVLWANGRSRAAYAHLKSLSLM
ncbi:protein FAR1-RELATED SEQUENCE 5-like [Gastrolobium bilobum]|uniref:protein FAR1-RELATED SEQUENCE 5-like n=1 Tax=Gastrolobium bilobum TaxID=150636 RepID=UPI002AAF8238|nr:protein FAR1-RELATED SEQUENCE 5-like [Gastrolobium bilobum]